MKKIFIGMFLFLMGSAVFSQGLEGIVVEKYYKTSAADAANDGSDPQILVQGATTYRIFVDMLDGYKFKLAFGNSNHELFFESTTGFYNNNDRGAATANGVGASRVDDNTVALDSWISVGAASDGHLGILKSLDTPPSILLLSNDDPDPEIGPLNTVDGLVAGTPSALTAVGLLADGSTAFQDAWFGEGLTGPRLTSNDLPSGGSWASFAGASGPAGSGNQVLIAQLTTDGDFTFELNIIIESATGVAERYVARNPISDEVEFLGLRYTTVETPNELPLITLDSPFEDTNANLNEVLTFDATATDSDGSIANVEFFVNGVSIGTGAVSGTQYSIDWTADTEGAFDVYAVATDDLGGQTQSLTWTITVIDPNQAPVVNITSPINGSEWDVRPAPDGQGSVVTLSATAVDNDGTVAQVEFFVNGVSVGIDNSSPYEATWTAVLGNNQTVTATATDNLGKEGSASVTFDVIDGGVNYTLGGDVSVPCYSNSVFCLPLIRVNSDLDDVNGFDVKIVFEPSKVTPTGVVTVNDLFIGRDYTGYVMRVDNDTIYLSLFLNSTAPADLFFEGQGEIFCVEFTRNIDFAAGDVATFSMPEIRESQEYTSVLANAPEAVTYTTFVDDVFEASLKFWADNGPISGPEADGYHLTRFGNEANTYAVEPDVNGNVAYDFGTGGTNVVINKDIQNTNFGAVIFNLFGGYDAYLVARVLVDDASFMPNVYQIIAMDVNNDGRVTAGDLSQINQRAVERRLEFDQVDNDGNPITAGPTRDWVWVDNASLISQPKFRVSTAWPYDDGLGYSKSRVPKVLENYVIDTGFDPDCPVTENETFTGILKGDVDGSYKDLAYKTTGLKSAKTPSTVIFDLAGAVFANGYFEIPVLVSAESVVHALDFSMKYNQNKLSLSGVLTHRQYITSLYNNVKDNVLVTSYSLDRYETDVKLFTVRFYAPDGVSGEDFMEETAFVNGVPANITKTVTSVMDSRMIEGYRVYPNPASTILNVEVQEDANIQIMDLSGKQVYVRASVKANEKNEIDVTRLASGIYLMKIYNNEAVSLEKVVIQK